MFWFSQVFFTLFSGALFALAIPNELFKLGCPILGIFALVPFYIVITRAKSYREAFWQGFIHGGFTHLLSSYWLGNFHGLAAFTLGASLVGTAFIEAFVSLFIYFPFSNIYLDKNKACTPDNSYIQSWYIPLKIFWFAGTWVIYEWCKSTGFLAYPWGTLSMTAVSWPLITQIADITEQYGVSFLFALISALTAQGILLFNKSDDSENSKNLRFHYTITARCVFVIIFSVVCYGIWQYNKPRLPVKHVNTVMVQHNLDTVNGNEELILQIAKDLTDSGLENLKDQELKPDLVVWSEGILHRYFPAAQKYYERNPESLPLMKYIKNKKLPFIIGGALVIDRDQHKFGNCAALIDKNGKYTGSYVKLHLVPFAEAIPFVEYEKVREIIKKIAGFSYGWTQGKKYVVFEIPIENKNAPDTEGSEIISLSSPKKAAKEHTVRFSTPICFDDAYGHVFRGLFNSGSELFINITNDSWSKTESAEYQHFAVAYYRAIEFRTTLARCTNSGFTAIIDPAGKIVDSLPLFTASSLTSSIPVYEHLSTFASIWGDWLPYTLIFLVLSFTVFWFLNSIESQIKDITVELVTAEDLDYKPTEPMLSPLQTYEIPLAEPELTPLEQPAEEQDKFLSDTEQPSEEQDELLSNTEQPSEEDTSLLSEISDKESVENQ